MRQDTLEDRNLPAVQELLACPHCRARLEFGATKIRCAACNRIFPFHDRIPLLARMDEPDREAFAHQIPTRTSYEKAYQPIDAAMEYNAKYERHLLKRWTTRREFQLLRRLLATQRRSRLLLELPCGGGRLSPAMAPYADLIIEADVALGQIQYGRQNNRMNTQRIWMAASALHIPFRDGSVDGVVCIRLCHHLPHRTERERLITELLRVASRFVILTFFDYHSLKNLLRRARQPFNKKRAKYTMTDDEIREIAARQGARLEMCPTLSWIGSGHRYALLVKP